MVERKLIFISEENYKIHTDYLRTLKLRYNVLEKSMPQIKGRAINEILRMKLPREDKNEILDLMSEIKAHELYFSSFDKPYRTSKCVKEKFGSEASFLYDVYLAAKKITCGFLFIIKDLGIIKIITSRDYPSVFIKQTPVLAIDLMEHSYFIDYGFEREEYISRAVSCLNLSLLD